MKCFFSDASYWRGFCGVAVAAPPGTWEHGRKWRSTWKVTSVRVPEGDFDVFFAAFPCGDSNEAELRALGLAFALAAEYLLESGSEDPVEVVSDSMMALEEVLGEKTPKFGPTEEMRTFYRKGQILLSKVKGHRGNRGNELADMWSRKARLKGSEKGGHGASEKGAERRRKNMYVPFDKDRAGKGGKSGKGSYGNDGGRGSADSCSWGKSAGTPFAGASEVDLTSLTEKLLDSDECAAVITRDGRIVARNDALRMGETNFTELVKQRVWGARREMPSSRSSYEEDIASFVERVLGDEDVQAVVTSEGQVMERNEALRSGRGGGTELLKQRVWGGDAAGGDIFGRGATAAGGFEEAGAASFYEELEAPLLPVLPVSVSFDEEALRVIWREASEESPLETGGVLVGTWEAEEGSDGGAVHVRVRRATTVGEGAYRGRACLNPDLEYYRRRVGYYDREFGWSYLGEWHKHPGSLSELSCTDLETAALLLREERHPFLVLPVVSRGGDGLRMDVYVVVPGEDEEEPRVFRMGQEFPSGLDRPVGETRLFVDARSIAAFRDGEAEEMDLEGVWNPDAGYVFLGLPGVNDAVLHLVKNCPAATVKDSPRDVLGILCDDGILRFFAVFEGETREIRDVTFVDPSRDVYARNGGILETLRLAEKRVCLVGCGSLGSTVAAEFARAGVGSLVLVDPDVLEPHNICRHQASLADLGRFKVDAVSDVVRRISPSIEVTAAVLDVTESVDAMHATEDLVRGCDLLCCTTDTDESRMFLNDLALGLGIPCIQTGLHERARSGIVQLVRPGSACFLCHRGKILDESAKRGSVAYSEASEVSDLTVQPGLSAQINLVAEVAVLRALRVLGDGENGARFETATPGSGSEEEVLPPDLTLAYMQSFDESDGAGTFPLRIVHFRLEKNPCCPVCGRKE